MYSNNPLHCEVSASVVHGKTWVEVVQISQEGLQLEMVAAAWGMK